MIINSKDNVAIKEFVVDSKVEGVLDVEGFKESVTFEATADELSKHFERI